MESLPEVLPTENVVAQPANTVAFIIAIEDYRFGGETGINSVTYARADATKFKKLLMEDFNVPEDNITMWLDNNANQSAFENELRYHIGQLTKDDRLIFYYAGHGFYQNSHNKLTCWDTHINNLNGTTVALNNVLLEPLQQSDCRQSLIFLDCCATNLTDQLDGRDLLASLEPRKFDAFIRAGRYNALFMSCSPGEKSYPSKILGQGIWTWHLIEALKGNVKEALVGDTYITDTSLKNYLSFAVPKFITDSTTQRNTQRPYAKIDASNEFLIRELPAPQEDVDASTEIPKLKLDFGKASFRRTGVLPVNRADGFTKKHFVPDVVNATSNAFIQRVFEGDVEEDIQTVYNNAKDILSLRRRDISAGISNGGSVECAAFRYAVDVQQDSDNPRQALITRTLTIRVPRAKLPENFDDIFPTQINEIVIPILGHPVYEDLVDSFENLEDLEGGKLVENPLTEEIEYTTANGISMAIDLENKLLIISSSKNMKYLRLFDASVESLKRVSSDPVKLLN